MNDTHTQSPEHTPRYLFNDGPPTRDEELILPPSLHHAQHTAPPDRARFFLAMLSGAALFTWGWLIGAYIEQEKEEAPACVINPIAAPALALPVSEPAPAQVVALPATLPSVQAVKATSLVATSLEAPPVRATSLAAIPAEVAKRPATPAEETKSPLPSAPEVKEKPKALWRSISFVPCKIIGEGSVAVEVTVAPDGTITQASGDSPLGKCVAKQLTGKPGFSAGGEAQQTITVKVR